VRIGPIQLSTPFCQAGLAGYSDRAMRLVARRRGCPYAVTEALLDIIMVNGGEGLRRSIDISDEDHPVAGQIMGSEPDTMSKAAGLLQRAGYDVIDLNFACPVKKIRNKARGGHMLLDVERAVSIVKAVRDSLPPHVPTTLSMRRAFDDSTQATDRFYQILESAWDHGYCAVRVHGRTVEQKYLGRADWSALREVKRRYPDKTILGSGDVFTAEDAVRMLRETGVDIVWIARGAIGNPWIFQHAASLHRDMIARSMHPRPESQAVGQNGDAAGGIKPPGIHEQREALREHFSIAMEIHGEQLAGRRMRKMGIKYSRFHPMAERVKGEFINVRSMRDWNSTLEKHYADDGPGVWPEPGAADEVNEPSGSCEMGV
jgi:tRNA-dihydrouridine synthase B